MILKNPDSLYLVFQIDVMMRHSVIVVEVSITGYPCWVCKFLEVKVQTDLKLKHILLSAIIR